MEGGGGMMVKEEVYSGDVGTRWRCMDIHAFKVSPYNASSCYPMSRHVNKP